MASNRTAIIAVAVAGLGLGTWLILRQPSTEVRSAAPPDVITDPLPADALVFQTLARAPAGDRALKDGDRLAAGESLHFRVRSTRPGHLLIARIDRLGGTHLVYPANRGGRAATVQPSDSPRDLGQALDHLAGEEHLVALLCARPFVFDTVRPTLRADRLSEPALAGCAQASRRLVGGAH